MFFKNVYCPQTIRQRIGWGAISTGALNVRIPILCLGHQQEDPNLGRASTHGPIHHGGPIQLFLVPASALRLMYFYFFLIYLF